MVIYTDGACSGNPGPGGWAAILLYRDKRLEISGYEGHTTNNRMELMAAIRGLAGRKTVILISHRLANVVGCSRIYVLENGCVAESGAHAALLAQGGLYSRLYNTQRELEQIGKGGQPA